MADRAFQGLCEETAEPAETAETEFADRPQRPLTAESQRKTR